MGEGILVVLLTLVITAMVYKYRHELSEWLKKPPRRVRDGLMKDLEVLNRYKVEDRHQRIIAQEEDWQRDTARLEQGLKQMRAKVAAEFSEEKKE